MRPDTTYRAIELVFDTNLDAILTEMSKQVKKLFADKKFTHATLIVDVHNPSDKPLFR